MKIGTKSLLFGVHQVLLHPLMVAWAWKKLYGFPWDFRLWVCFIVHDWGYWGAPEMDGPIGDQHPRLGAQIVHKLLDRNNKWDWYNLCIHHSRFLAAKSGNLPSRLCMADKLSVTLEPWWFYLPRAWASGELKEYMNSSKPEGKHGHLKLKTDTSKGWYQSFQVSMQKYVGGHKDGQKDLITPVK